MRSWTGATTSLGWPVTIVHECSSVSGSSLDRHTSHSPAKASGRSSVPWMKYGCLAFWPSTLRHS